MIVNIEKVHADLKTAKGSLATYLSQLTDLHETIDLGTRVRSVPIISREERDFTPYVTQGARLSEAAIIQNPCIPGEHALYYAWNGEHGTAAFVRGLRYPSFALYQFPDQVGDPLASERAAHECLVQGKRTLSYVFYGAPVFYDSGNVLITDLFRQVHQYLIAEIALRDGFLPWDNPDELHKLFGLIKQGWNRQ